MAWIIENVFRINTHHLQSPERSRSSCSLLRFSRRSEGFAMCWTSSRSRHLCRTWKKELKRKHEKDNKRKQIFLPALQRRNVKMLVVEDHRYPSLRMIHVVLRCKTWGWHFGINSSVSSAAECKQRRKFKCLCHDASSKSNAINCVSEKFLITLASWIQMRPWSFHHNRHCFHSWLHSFWFLYLTLVRGKLKKLLFVIWAWTIFVFTTNVNNVVLVL